MNLKKILLQLSVPDAQEILAIDLDKGQGQGPGVYPGTPGQEGEKGLAGSLSPCFRGQLRPGAEESFLELARVSQHVKV